MSETTTTETTPRLRLTYWVPTQYSVDLDPAELAAKLRSEGYPEAASTAEQIARGEIASGDDTEDAQGPLADLARAIRKTDDGTLTTACGEPVDYDDSETYHVYVGEPR